MGKWSGTQELMMHEGGNLRHLLWAKNHTTIYFMSNPIDHVKAYNCLPFIEN